MIEILCDDSTGCKEAGNNLGYSMFCVGYGIYTREREMFLSLSFLC